MTLNEIFDFIKQKTEELDVKWGLRDGMIRCVIDHKRYCPITFIYKLKKGLYEHVDKAFVIHKELGISYDDTITIILAADSKTHVLRKRLKEVCKKTKSENVSN